MSIEFSTVEVGAALASEWLQRNTHNRSISPSAVRRYAEVMLDGRWRVTGETVEFADDGRLIDGQHRLAAIVLANQKQPGFSLALNVVRNVPSEAFDVIGQGRMRRASDALDINGHRSSRMLGAAANYYLDLRENNWSKERRDNSVIVECVREHPLLSELTPLASKVSRIHSSPALFVAIAAIAVEEGVPRVVVQDFANSLHNGADLGEKSPVLALREFCLSRRLQGKSIHFRTLAYVTLRALQAYNHGKTLSRLASTLLGANDLAFNLSDLATKEQKEGQK